MEEGEEPRPLQDQVPVTMAFSHLNNEDRVVRDLVHTHLGAAAAHEEPRGQDTVNGITAPPRKPFNGDAGSFAPNAAPAVEPSTDGDVVDTQKLDGDDSGSSSSSSSLKPNSAPAVEPTTDGDIVDAQKIGNVGGDGSKPLEDESDAWRFGKARSPGPPTVRMPVEKDAEAYNMNHRRRGVALIFNHKRFDHHLQLRDRNGTDADKDNLRSALRSLDFEVRVYTDLPFKELERILECCSRDEDHSDADCLLVAVLSHGESGILYASNHAYKPDRLWSHFHADRCPTLAGKPKLFFIQACQGDQLDSGVVMTRRIAATETDGAALSYKIPAHADFLIAYSTVPGYYSWRNTTAGSWFVQSLCHVLSRHGHTKDLLSILTRVARMVALDFQSNTPGDFSMHEKKQIPCISTMLTRDVFFHRKRPTLV